MKLRTRITLTLSLAVTCIVAAVGLTLYAVAREGLRAQVQLRVSHVATSMRDRLESGMRERARDLRNFAALEASLARTPNALRSAMARVQASHNAYAWIGLVDGTGQLREIVRKSAGHERFRFAFCDLYGSISASLPTSTACLQYDRASGGN